MLLDALRDFEWLNEPREFAFNERGLKITASSQTDFWQDGIGGYNKDNGHFFFANKQGAYTVTVHWRCGIPKNFAQCGLMGRINEKFWFKISLFSKSGQNMNIGSVVTNDGNSDMALSPILSTEQEIFFRVKKSENGIFELSYSQNGISFVSVRRFRLNAVDKNIDVGAFICSPSEEPYTAVLISVDFS